MLAVIYSVSVLFILAVILFVLIIVLCPERFFYIGYFKLWRRVHVKWRGMVDYFWYTLSCSLRTSPITKIPASFWYLQKKIFFWLPFLFPAIMILFYKVQDLFSEIWFIISVVFFCIDFYRNNRTEKLNTQYVEIRSIPEAYQNITADDGSCLLNFKAGGSVFVNSGVNEWLMSAQNIGLRCCREYEKGLRSQICNEDNWENIYLLFLHNNYVKSMHFGYQFINESKLGISGRLDPTKDCVEVHKTCYFDSYLTNIIPGKHLVRLVDGKVVADTEKFMPYNQDRILLDCWSEALRNNYRANQVGISALLILPDGRIVFWRQNHFVLSDSGKIVTSGSGSVDWEDCKHFMTDPDGFRKAITRAMQREIWEESYSSEGRISEKDFINNTETRIIGHFRWLQKSGKYEFVGITRFLQELRGCNAPKPCNMEVVATASPKIFTIGDALRSFPVPSYESDKTLPNFMGTMRLSKIRKYHDKSRPEVKITKETITLEEVEIKTINDAINFSENNQSNPDSFIEIKDYSVPCVMAILYFRQLCEDYCAQCPQKAECLSGNIHCVVRLEEALFTSR